VYITQANSNGNGKKDIEPNDVDLYEPVVWGDEEIASGWYKSKLDSEEEEEGEFVIDISLDEESESDNPDN
jgi:hypothetical protein